MTESILAEAKIQVGHHSPVWFKGVSGTPSTATP